MPSGVGVTGSVSIAGIDDGVEELVFDLMEFGVPHAEALLGDSIASIHQAIQHRSIRGLGHCVGSFPLCEWADWCRVGQKRDRLLVVEQHGRKSLVLVVPHKDDDLVL